MIYSFPWSCLHGRHHEHDHSSTRAHDYTLRGTGMNAIQNSQQFRVRIWKYYLTHGSSGYCGTGVQNSQTFRAGTRNAVPVPRVLWHGTYRSRRSSWYEYESLTELTEVPGVLTRAYRTHRSPGRHNKVVPVLRVLWPRASRIYRRSRYGYE